MGIWNTVKSVGSSIVHTAEHVVAPVVHTVEHVAAPIVNPIAHVVAPVIRPIIKVIPSVIHVAENTASSIGHGVVSGVSFGGHVIGSGAMTAWTAATHPADTVSKVWHAVVVPVVTPVVHAAETTAVSVANTAVDAAKITLHAVEHPVDTVKAVVTEVAHVSEQVATTVGTVAVDTAKQIGNDAVVAATTIAGAAVDAAHSVADGAQKLGGEVVDTAGTMLHDGAKAAEDVGKAIVTTAADVGQGAVETAGDALHTAAQVGGDVAHAAGDLATGHVEDAVKDVATAGSDLAQGAAQVGGDVVHTASTASIDVGQGVVQAASDVGQGAVDLAHGTVDAAGTAAGVAGQLAQDFETAAGGLVKGAVDATVHLANGEISAVTGVADVGAQTIGGPVAGFYDKVIDAYGDAAKTTLTHVGGAVDDGVGQLTHAGGDIARSLGDGADTLGHDTGQVINDVGNGDFDAAGHDIGKFGSDAVDAGKQFGEAEIEGAKALGAAASDVETVLNGLDEAMGRAAGGFVSAVGETVGGDAGKAIDDFGKIVGDSTAAASALASGDVAGAAKEAAKEVIGKGADWANGELHQLTDELGDAVGGKAGDLIKTAGGAADDALIDKAKDFLNDVSTKGIDKMAGTEPKTGDQADADKPGSDGHPAATDPPAAPDNRSLLEKGLDAAEDKGRELIDKGIDALTHPDATMQKAAEMLQEKLGGDKAAGAIHKIDDAVNGSHDHAESATGVDHKEALGTSHSALVAQNDQPVPQQTAAHVDPQFAPHGAITDTKTYGDVLNATGLGHAEGSSTTTPIGPITGLDGDRGGTSSPHIIDFGTTDKTMADGPNSDILGRDETIHPTLRALIDKMEGAHGQDGTEHRLSSFIGNTGLAPVVHTASDPSDPSKIIVTGLSRADPNASSVHPMADARHGGGFWDHAADAVSQHHVSPAAMYLPLGGHLPHWDAGALLPHHQNIVHPMHDSHLASMQVLQPAQNGHEQGTDPQHVDHGLFSIHPEPSHHIDIHWHG